MSNQPQPPPSGQSKSSSSRSRKSSPPVSPPYSSSPILESRAVPGSGSQSDITDGQTLSPDSISQPGPSRASLISDDVGSRQPPRYSVASHSVRITKYGYTIDPVELLYPEIINSLSSVVRRGSDISFDAGQAGHKILSLIRGFWSQPAFPRGKLIKNDKLNSINAMLNEFAQYPFYPHEDTLGNMGKARPKAPPKRLIKRSVTRGANQQVSPSDKSSSSSDDPRTRAFFNDPTRPSSPPLESRSTVVGKTNGRAGSELLSLFITRQTKSPPSKQTTTAPQPPTGRSSSVFHSWIPKNKEQAYDLIIKLLQKMERIFSAELRIINIKSPCTVLGDIHGNLIDLRTYERSLWPKAPNCLTCNYLFLGDYVDRGEYSIECVLYLFAMKSLVPDRFFLLRGNHEVAAIQRQYTFGRECEMKFGSYGRDLWLAFNKVFDLMPVAGVIDNQIFCAHGGIPRSVSDIRSLANVIPSPLDNPELQCPAAWEILWNDPITDSELIGIIEMDNAIPTTAIQVAQPSPSPPEQPVPVPAQGPDPAAPTNQSAPEVSSATTTARDDIDEFTSATNAAPSAALSTYIRPDASAQQQAQQQTATGSAAESKSVARASKEAGRQTADTKEDQANRLIKIPSDTSSIASSSPQQIISDGFIANIKRGTAYLFSDQAVNNFLSLNKLSHVIRAHEVIPTGFAFHGEGRVITIFSSSKYCGLNNQAACALVERDKIRILRLDTGDAGE